jgi:adenylosuccinate lyase
MIRLKRDPFFAKINLDHALDPASFIGRAPEQTDRFIASMVEPIRARYSASLASKVELRV